MTDIEKLMAQFEAENKIIAVVGGVLFFFCILTIWLFVRAYL